MTTRVHPSEDVELNLGPCHYGGFAESATIIARARDGIGWIPVCDDHRQRAIADGFEPVEE